MGKRDDSPWLLAIILAALAIAVGLAAVDSQGVPPTPLPVTPTERTAP